MDEKVKFINYTIDTVNGTVYLFGIAQDREELEEVIAVARQINYVENIINYVTLSSIAIVALRKNAFGILACN